MRDWLGTHKGNSKGVYLVVCFDWLNVWCAKMYAICWLMSVIDLMLEGVYMVVCQ